MTFCVVTLNMRVSDFWQLTFAEFWPLYNAKVGNTITPMTEDDLDDLESTWAGGN